MESNKRNFLVAFLILLFIGLVSVGYFFVFKGGKTQVDILRAIPSDASVIVSTHSGKGLWDKLRTSEQWLELTKPGQGELARSFLPFQQFDQKLNWLDSVAGQNPKTESIIRNQPFMMALLSFDSIQEPLFVFALESPGHKRQVINFIKSLNRKNPARESVFEGEKIFALTINNDQRNLFFTVSKGLLLMGFSPLAVHMSISQLQSDESLLTNEHFLKVAKTAGKKVEANVFVNQRLLLNSLKGYLKEEHRGYLFRNFSSAWTVLDLNIKNREILLNGFSGTRNDQPGYLNLFQSSKASQTLAQSILPYNTMFFYTLSAESFDQYYQGVLNYFEIDVSASSVKQASTTQKDLIDLLGNEITMAYAEPSTGGIADYRFFAIHSSNVDLLKDRIIGLTNASVGLNAYQKNLYQMGNAEPIKFLFEPLMDKGSITCFMILDGWCIFGSNIDALKKYTGWITTGRSLGGNSAYLEFSDNISESSNLYLYLNFRKANELMKYAIHEDYQDDLLEISETLSLFEGPAMQFSYMNGLFYTNFYFRYNPSVTEDEIFNWQVKLDTAISKGPYLVKDHNTGNYNTIIFDHHNLMYMIDPMGQILWTKQLSDPVISDLIQIDFYRNNKLQYLFNSRNRIYLVDLKGQDVAGYPIKLDVPDTNGLAVFADANTKNYRIFLASEDNRVYSFSKIGDKVKGWRSPKLPEKMSLPVKRLVVNNRDYIVMALDNGNVLMTDRKGKTRLTIKKSFTNSLRSDFYRNMTNSRGIMITTDINGDLIYIPKTGGIQSTKFGEFTNEPWFLYEDMDGDRNHDFVFFDQTDLIVFNRLKDTLMHHRFETGINSKPQILELDSGEKLLGISDHNTNRVYLFNIKGLIGWSSKMMGGSPMDNGKLNTDSEESIVVGAGDVIYNYILE